MKAVVVLCIDEISDKRYAEISLAYSINHWWYNNKGVYCTQVTPELPLYLALFIKERIDVKLLMMPHLNWRGHDLYALVTDWITDMISSLDSSWNQHFEPLWSKESKGEHVTTLPEWSRETLQEDAMRILPYIEGRRWLFEHLEKRIKMIGIRLNGYSYSENRMRSYLYLLLQYLYLSEEIEMTSGITLVEQNGKLQAQCERCGSVAYGIHLHYCSICGHDDLVCDTCFVMGVSKGCSLVISRPTQIEYNREADHGPFLQEVAAGFYSEKKWNGEL